jgi:quinol monooxygenase YgiN
MSIYVTVRARLKNDPAASKALHDEVTLATKDMAIKAGDVGHLIYLGGQDARDLLGIDEWKSAEAFQAFASNPKIREFFGQLFEGEPEVRVWKKSDWNQW